MTFEPAHALVALIGVLLVAVPVFAKRRADRDHVEAVDQTLADVREQKCPNCKSYQSLMAGPRGGACVNCQCAVCGAEYNVGLYGNSIFMVEPIHRHAHQ